MITEPVIERTVVDSEFPFRFRIVGRDLVSREEPQILRLESLGRSGDPFDHIHDTNERAEHHRRHRSGRRNAGNRLGGLEDIDHGERQHVVTVLHEFDDRIRADRPGCTSDEIP